VGVRAFQEIFLSIDQGRPPLLNATAPELQGAVTNVLDFAGKLLSHVLNVLGSVLDLVPIAAVSTFENRLALEAAWGTGKSAYDFTLSELIVATRRVIAKAGKPLAIPQKVAAAHRIKRAVGAGAAEAPYGVANTFNLTDLIGFDYILILAESPWPRVLSNLINGGIAVVNGTWGMVLLTTEATGTIHDVRFFQWGAPPPPPS
jgi:hypothetical protein